MEFEDFFQSVEKAGYDKLGVAVSFIWYHTKTTEEKEANVAIINGYFEKAHLAKYNPSRLAKDFKASRSVTKGSKDGYYKLQRSAIQDFDKQYGHIFEIKEEITIVEKASLKDTPFLTEGDFAAAHKMASLYVILHCYENSARRLIENVLSTKFGPNWWDSCVSEPLKKKYIDRKAKEVKNKWISPRGAASPLFYVDWPDLVTIIRRYEPEFIHIFPNMGFIDSRLGELELIRNIVAHHGVLPSDDDFDRVVLSFKDWCRQLK